LHDSAFSGPLLAWWDKHGRKDLPWQHPRSPYRVWVSEIMLQQTQVKTVIPYFENFIERFTDFQIQANATTDEVLSMWSGLGYNARARNLQKAAKICVSDHQAKLPKQPQALLALPGIGESTANAIYSQAHDIPAVILDGNVKRVLSRYFAVEGWPGKSDIHKKLWGIAESLLPENRGADYSQATMDLGATLCTRSKPACSECPVQKNCKAFLHNTVALYPGKRPRLKVTQKSFQMLIIFNKDGNVLLERRPPTGIWGGLWSLPADDDGRLLEQRLGVEISELRSLPEIKHQLTHIQMHIQPLIGHAEPAARSVECSSDQRWFSQDDWPNLGLPKPVRQLLETQWRMLEHD
jgi:A/G-specific adenine glycosylase